MAEERPAPSLRAGIAAAVFLTLWGLITHGTFAGSGDAPHYLMAAQSIAFDGDFDLANNYADPDNLVGSGSLPPELHAQPGRDGVLRPAHDVGLPLLFAPVVRLAYPLAAWLGDVVPRPILARARLDGALIFRHLISLTMAIVAAALAIQFFEMASRGTASHRTAAAWSLLVVLSPPLLSHGFVFFTELPSALLVLWCARVLSAPGGTRPPWGRLGAASGLLLLVHVRNIAAVLGLAAWAVSSLRRTQAPRSAWAAWAAGFAALLAVRTALVYLFWGTFLTTPLASLGDLRMPLGIVVREVLVRTSGLLLDQEFGLLPYGPVYLLAPAGIVLAWRRLQPGDRWMLFLAAAYVGAVVSPHLNVHGWTGGWSPATRMVTPVVPLVALFVLQGARVRSRARRAVVGGIVAMQVAIDAVVWQWPKVLWNHGDGTGALVASMPVLADVLPAWHGPAPSAARFLWFGLAWAALTAWLVRGAPAVGAPVERRPGHGPVSARIP